MNLDNLHKVMKGDMTIDQACEGMTDDFEIGHVSHRKDGDYRKVAQGKWVPVKAGGQGQMGAKKEDGAGKPQAGQATQEEIDTYKEIVHQFAKNKNPMTEKIMNMAKEHLMKSRGVSAEQIAKIGSDVFWENDKDGQQGADVPLQNKLGKAENHEQMTKVLYDEITRNGKENTIEKLWALYKGEDLGADMQTYIEETGKETGLRGKDACRMVIEKAEEDGAPLREGEKEQNKNVLTSADDVNWDIVEQVQKEAYKANETHTAPEMMEKYDITQIQKFANQNVDTGFANVDGIRGYLKKKAGLPGGVDLNVASKELAKFNNWQNARNIWRRYENKELDVDETGHFYVPEPAKPKAEGGKRQLKRRADGTIIYETPEDVIYDMVENYNELDRGDLQGVIEAAAMSHGWDENEILEEVDRQAAEKYNLGVDSAPARLTRDTKIRLSRIKR